MAAGCIIGWGAAIPLMQCPPYQYTALILLYFDSFIVLKDLWHGVHASNIDVGRGVLQCPTLLLLVYVSQLQWYLLLFIVSLYLSVQ